MPSIIIFDKNILIFFKNCNSNPINPSIHHWSKTFPLFSAKPKFQNPYTSNISRPKI
jgi:hypothetical protein